MNMGEAFAVHTLGSTVVLSGDIDTAARSSVLEALADAVRDCTTGRVVIDLASATFFGSDGVNALVHAQHATQAAGLVLELRPGPPNIMRTIDVAGLDFLFRHEVGD
ncbi:MAG: anti-sigma factor antagonist [Acidimicrobiaceae bacterium]|jgi:anti-anti-sigma factor